MGNCRYLSVIYTESGANMKITYEKRSLKARCCCFTLTVGQFITLLNTCHQPLSKTHLFSFLPGWQMRKYII